ncbi:hypothetical protein PHISCL_05751 [Aspergillus sclerotialis]|uniref:Tautomerase cis-CaaD-like domain-containing protein n=1 Tax=Aspergillus sclerotialis TaxID=2070753 RepID=A0A3A2ZFY4_9EURO|nr:hypothetical protein PHISCL_05751 [Aspergillus sclerotialis]
MPFYEIEHAFNLPKSQRDELAQAITRIHARKFAAPSLFVNIRFTDSKDHRNYVGGKECDVNRIFAYVRAGGTRKKADFDDLAHQIVDAWDRIINSAEEGSREKVLNRVFVMDAITAGVESGFALPRAGEDGDWLKANMLKFEQLAAEGDENFVRLVDELRSREDLPALRI